MNWATVLKSIPRKEFVQKFSRSSGPGGQNVNKVNTKAVIKLERTKLANASWLPSELRQKLLDPQFTYATPKGDIMVTSELTRSQSVNLENCFVKLSQEIAKAAFVPREPSIVDRAKWQRLAKREQAVKRDQKQRQSTKKRDRRLDD